MAAAALLAAASPAAASDEHRRGQVARAGVRPGGDRHRGAQRALRPRRVQERRGRRLDPDRRRRDPGRAGRVARRGLPDRRDDRGRRDARRRGRGARRAARGATAPPARSPQHGVPKSRAAVAAARRDGDPACRPLHQLRRHASCTSRRYNKATVVHGHDDASAAPTQALSYAGADGVYSAAVDVPRYIDTTTTPDTYMFHRQLVRLTGSAAQIPVGELTVRVASSSGAVDTSKVTELAGRHAAAARRGLPAGLLRPLPGPDGEPRAARQARGRVPEPGDRGQPAAPVARATSARRRRWSAAGPGRPRAWCRSPTRRAPGRRGGAQAVVLSSKAWGHEGGNGITAQIVAGTGANAPLLVGVAEQGDQGHARHRRRRRADQHRRRRRRRDQRQPGRERARHRRDLPRQRGHRRPAHAAARCRR